MNDRRGGWRRPVLAPVYAAVIACGAVGLTGWVVTTTLSSPAEVGFTVEVSRTPLPAAARVCLSTPKDWHISEPSPSPTPLAGSQSPSDVLDASCRRIEAPAEVRVRLQADRP